MQQTSDHESVSDRFRHNFSKSYLADTFGISRPTLYKYMDLYDNSEIGDIPGRVLEFFDYVSETERTYEEMVTFLERVSFIHQSEPLVKDRSGLQWVTETIRTVPVTNNDSVIIVFKDSMDHPDETVLRVYVNVSDEDIVIAEVYPEPRKHFVKVKDLPTGVSMTYVMTQKKSDAVIQSEPVEFILHGR